MKFPTATATATATITTYYLRIEDSNSHKNIPLEQEIYSIGRNPESTIVIDSPQASRHHATLVRRQNPKTKRYSYWIIDGNLDGNRSYNGLYINGNSCLVQELKDGDLINFGCGVNASYHVMKKSSDKEIIEQNSNSINLAPTFILDDAPREQNSNSINLASTFILDDAPAITELELNAYDTLESLSFNDPLTHLPNPTLFREHFSLALANAERQNYSMALIYLDLPDFPQLHQDKGNDFTNQLLQNVVQELNTCLRATDIVSRWAQSEFLILLSQLNQPADSDLVKQRILKTLQKPLTVQKERLSLHFKMGMALYPKEGTTLTDLENKAKAEAVSRCLILLTSSAEIEPITPPPVLKKVESSLFDALEQQELALYYQPQINQTTGEIVAMEGLLRWHHPRQGLVTPHRFINAVEQTDAMLPLCQWILKTACQQNRQWQNLGLEPLRISVNLSYRQLEQANFPYLVAKILDKIGLDPQWLELEISEKTLLTNTTLVSSSLAQLNNMGISLALDDFGTGYSSLTHLLQFPFKRLKIAQACVQQLPDNP
ncbi:MAG: EAL domain-containing protein, partial [Xenococcus sp. (in: cyanobacteria)]